MAAQALASEPPGAAVTATQEPAALAVAQSAVPAPLRVIPQVLSSRADMISGGDVLIRVPVPAGLSAADLSLRLDDTDISDRFTFTRDGQLIARLKGLQLGSAMFEAWVGDQMAGTVKLVNHPLSGPVFSGPHETPFVCQTAEFKLPGGEPLGEPLDEHCSVRTRVDYVYRPATPDAAFLRPLPAGPAPPGDVALLERDGKPVRYIVRLETGTVNRAIYQTAVLHDPYQDAEVAPWHSWPGWNHKLVYAFGGGCNGGWHRQGASVGDVLNDHLLSQGYAIASSSLNVFGNNCNEVLAAETMAMVKERFIKTVGVPRYTVGWGCSGGSYQQHFIADAYPGLLDGIIPGCSFPDLLSTITMLADISLLRAYFARPDAVAFTPAQQRVVAGVATLATLGNADIERGIKRIAVAGIVPDDLPRQLLFDAGSNPRGVRANVFSHGANYFGRDAQSGAALRPLDNVGVQYGLQALLAGQISIVQFLDLNDKIGGFDDNGWPGPARSQGAVAAIEAGYEAGLVTGEGALASVPVIDYRAYTDDLAAGDLHLRYHSFAVRARLARQAGGAANHVMFVEDNRYGLYSSNSPLLREALARMDAWLTALLADGSDLPPAEKVARHRPAGLVDVCMTREAQPRRIEESMHPLTGACASLYPAPAGPHVAAGGPLRGDILKCRLRAPRREDYPADMNDQHWRRLQDVFPQGVCDWSASGVGQDDRGGAWRRFPLRLPQAGAPQSEPALNQTAARVAARQHEMAPSLGKMLEPNEQ